MNDKIKALLIDISGIGMILLLFLGLLLTIASLTATDVFIVDILDKIPYWFPYFYITLLFIFGTLFLFYGDGWKAWERINRT